MPVTGRLPVKLVLDALSIHVTDASDLASLLGEALLALDAAGRKRLQKQLGPDLGGSIVLALETAFNASGGGTTPKTPAAIKSAWTRAWKLWDKVIAATNDDGGPYLQNEISYTTPDLDIDGVVADLDEAAAMLLPLIETVVSKNLAPRFNLTNRVTRSLASVAEESPWIIRPDDVFPVGPKLTRALLEWARSDARRRGATDDKLHASIEALEQTLAEEAGVELDPRALKTFSASLGPRKRAPRPRAKTRA